jgi:mRNA interferase RelE/StbE
MENQASARIISWINENLVGCEDPRRIGKALKGKYEGTWRYRVGDYRIIAKIYDDELKILILDTGHRKKIYR